VVADLVGGVGEDTAEAVGGLLHPKGPDGSGEQGVGGPGGAIEDAGGAGRGRHGGGVLAPLFLGDVLGLVGLEEEVGRCSDDTGVGEGTEEEGASAVELDDVILALSPRVSVPRVVEPVPQAEDGVDGLGLEGGGGLDDLAPPALVEVEQVCLELGEQLVFAGLAAHGDDESLAVAVEDGVEDGVGGLELVGA
jgi:hypothetical protein